MINHHDYYDQGIRLTSTVAGVSMSLSNNKNDDSFVNSELATHAAIGNC